MGKIAFLSETPHMEGKIPSNHPNLRTDLAWMYALNADHFNILKFDQLKNYDHVFIIFPKGKVNLCADGSVINNRQNPFSSLLNSNIIQVLKSNNKKIHYIQEGPHWWFNDYEIIDQFNFYNLLAECDSIFAHNEHDTKFYKGLFPNKQINIIPTLLIEESIKDFKPNPEEKVIIGGNFARWYGGFQSYLVADEFKVEKWAQESHAKRKNEDQIPDLNHLPRLTWIDWMKTLSTFKYAVHLMPTVAAGTFSLNCAYFGIPCIGNEKVDTQRLCHPDLSVDVDDVEKARKLAKQLKEDKEWYKHCSKIAKWNYQQYYKIEQWKENITLV
tara:strand:- start:107 stop:1090 length:984 start_codon:yes stop_codon:yes gene_type:complete